MFSKLCFSPLLGKLFCDINQNFKTHIELSALWKNLNTTAISFRKIGIKFNPVVNYNLKYEIFRSTVKPRYSGTSV